MIKLNMNDLFSQVNERLEPMLIGGISIKSLKDALAELFHIDQENAKVTIRDGFRQSFAGGTCNLYPEMFLNIKERCYVKSGVDGSVINAFDWLVFNSGELRLTPITDVFTMLPNQMLVNLERGHLMFSEDTISELERIVTARLSREHNFDSEQNIKLHLDAVMCMMSLCFGLVTLELDTELYKEYLSRESEDLDISADNPASMKMLEEIGFSLLASIAYYLAVNAHAGCPIDMAGSSGGSNAEVADVREDLSVLTAALSALESKVSGLPLDDGRLDELSRLETEISSIRNTVEQLSINVSKIEHDANGLVSDLRDEIESALHTSIQRLADQINKAVSVLASDDDVKSVRDAVKALSHNMAALDAKVNSVYTTGLINSKGSVEDKPSSKLPLVLAVSALLGEKIPFAGKAALAATAVYFEWSRARGTRNG